jgi:hypothetical protein
VGGEVAGQPVTDLSYTVVGWREWVSLPSVGVRWVKAKIDTGARTSALHAFDMTEFEQGGDRWVRYSVHPWQRSDDDAVEVESKVVDQRVVRSSNGQEEERLVVVLDVRLAGLVVPAEVTLSRRDEMGFRMLVGRQALAQGFLVDAGRSYAGKRPKRSVRRHNWGH